MLQAPNRLVSHDTAPPEFRSPVVSLADAADFIWRNLRTIMLMCLAMWAIAILYLIIAVPRFTAQATLVIESKATLGDVASVSTIVESQIQIIKSDTIARAVIQKLDLANVPEFLGQTGGLRSTIRSLARSLGWIKPETEAAAMRTALEAFEDKLSVKRVGVTYIVQIGFESIDPERAAQILNTVAETYIASQMDAKYQFTLRDQSWIKDRMAELSRQASAAQKALEDYHKNRKDIADPVDSSAERALAARVESSNNAYDNFRHVVRQMEATELSAPVREASLVSPALPPLKASSPKRPIVLALSTIAGVILGLAVGVLRELSYKGLRTRAQVWKSLQIACIAVVPTVKSCDARGRFKSVFADLVHRPTKRTRGEPLACTRNSSGSIAILSTDAERTSKRTLSNPTSTDDPRSRNIVRTESPIWASIEGAQSPFTESLVEIKLAIDSGNRSGKRNQIIGITSTQAKEGKSTIAVALALLMAHAGARVVLIDCNLRNRSLSAELAPTATSGILEVMTGTVSPSAVTWTDPLSRLSFIPVANGSRPLYVSDALTSETLSKFLEAFRKTYEYIIVDLPALTPCADVRIAADVLDSVIFVVEWGRTNIGVVERALNAYSDLDEIVLGVALNKAGPRL